MVGVLQGFKKHPVRRATVASILTGICGQAFLLVSGVLAARILGVEDRGYLALLVVFPTLCSQLFAMGFPQAITYQLAANPKELPAMVRLASHWYVWQIVAIMIVHGMMLWLYLGRNSGLLPSTAYMTLIIGPAMLAVHYGLVFLQGIGDYTRLVILRLFLPTAYALMLLPLFALGTGDLHRVTLVWVISLVCAGILALQLVRSLKIPTTGSTSSGKRLSQKEMLKFGLKGLVGSTSPMETFRLDQLAAGLLLSSSALGLYVVGQAFGMLTHLVAQSASMVAYPTVVSRGDGKAGQETVWRFFWAVTFINGVGAAILIVLVPLLIPLLFGQEFKEAIPVSQILLIGAALAASRRILVEGFRGLGKPQVSTIAEISMYPWLLTGGVLLVWQYGLQGLASAVTIGFFVSLSVAVWFGWNLPKETVGFPQQTGTEDAVP